MKKIIFLIAGVFACVSLNSCKEKNASAKDNNEDNVFFIEAKKPEIKNVSLNILIGADIKALEEAVIYSRINGKLTENVLKEGDKVDKDEPIAYVKKDEVGVVYEPAPVPSTIDGVVGRIYLDPGANVTLQTPIAFVVNQAKVRVKIDIPEKNLPDVYKGQKIKIKVDAYPDRYFIAEVEKISPIVDNVSKTALVEAIADNEKGFLKSGMFCEANIAVKEAKSALAVPVSALVYKEDKAYVYVFNPELSVVEERMAELGVVNADYAQVKNIKQNELIVTVGLYGIYDKAKAKISKNN